MKVYIAYQGYLNKFNNQVYNILGVFSDRDKAVKIIEDGIKVYDQNLEDTEVTSTTIEQIPTTWWIERGMDIAIVGKLEEHVLID